MGSNRASEWCEHRAYLTMDGDNGIFDNGSGPIDDGWCRSVLI